MLTEEQIKELAPAKTADARGTACPGPLLEAKTDVAAWAAKVGHEFLGVTPGQGYDRVFIRRGK